MNVEKKVLDDMYRCYATQAFEINGELTLFYASEEEGYPCVAYSGPDFSTKSIVWEKGGGCMSILPVPNKPNEFLAIRDFYLKVSPSQSRLVWGKLEDDRWIIKDMLFLPFLHRFGIFEVNGSLHFLGTTIADDKKNKEDWSQPGSIYTGVFPEDFNLGLTVTRIGDHYFRNHGFTTHVEDGQRVAYLSSDQGIVKAIPPYSASEWHIEPFMKGQVSEVAIGDIDCDGQDEYLTIEPFHGNALNIYRKTDQGFIKIYAYDHPIDFAHAVIYTRLKGVPTFLAGIRRMDCELVAFQWHDNAIKAITLDQGGGPANLFALNLAENDLVLSANHTENKAVVYVID